MGDGWRCEDFVQARVEIVKGLPDEGSFIVTREGEMKIHN